MTTTTAAARPVDFAAVYAALRHLDRMPAGRVADYSDFAALPADVRELCRPERTGFAALDAVHAHFAA
ncbi:MAG: hypothetical protein GY719_25760 [bacterium]|nr:hypothetical protein [bacterium]